MMAIKTRIMRAMKRAAVKSIILKITVLVDEETRVAT